MAYVTTGTTEAIFVQRQATSKVVCPGDAYFVVKIKGAQAAFNGPFWQGVKRLVVTSQVDLHLGSHLQLGEPVRGIEYSCEVQPGRAEKLGFEVNLISLVPATMTHVTVQIDYVLDTQNKLLVLADVINDQTLMSAVSLAPGAAVAAKTVSSVAQKLLQAFMGANAQQPILQFRKDFDIATEEMQEGYYIILATRDDKNPIPRPIEGLAIQGSEVFLNGQPVTQWSYVILEVRSQAVRGRDLSQNAEWEQRLRKAEAEAQDSAADSLADDEQKRVTWESCKELLKQARTLLGADADYLPRESRDIIATVYAQCYRNIFGRDPGAAATARGAYRSADGSPQAKAYEPDRLALDLPPAAELAGTIEKYAAQVEEARQAA